MKTLFLCGREVGYPLNQQLLQSFRQFSEVDVIDEMGSGKSILKRSLQVFWQAIPKLISNHYDLIFVGFYGHLLVLPTRVLSHSPILFNPFISTYETLVFDRKKVPQRSIPAKLAYWIDQTSCRLATHILMDTQANVAYFSQTFNIPKEKFHILFIGSDEKLFFPRQMPSQNHTIVLYHGSYLPLQGIDVIIQAAKLINHIPEIRFRMLGNGLEYNRIRGLVSTLGLSNLEFLPAVSLVELPDQIAAADICLGGHFGTSDKAARVIAGKTFQDLAMGKATIVGENSANHELLTHGYDAWFCPMNDPENLAHAVLTLAKNPDQRILMGTRAHDTFMKRASLSVLQPQLQQLVKKILNQPI